MIPTWIWTILVVIVGSIAALWLGSYLPQSGVNPITCLLLVVFAAFCVICAVYNNFPFLMALGTWIPFFPHLLGPSSLPTTTYFLVWMAAVLFFRLCVQGYVSYRQSFTWYLIIVFAWVPIRFMMNPVTKLGATAGGTGVSGALPYFNYVFALSVLIFLGAVLTDRNRVTYFMRWCNVIVLLSGVALTICAFIPATAPYLVAMGSFSAGAITDGVQRLVQLPGYGLYLVEASLCPALCRLKGWQCCVLFVLGFFMIVLGGNRSAIAAAVVVIPVVLFLRRQSHVTFLSLFLMVACIGMLRVTVDNMASGQIPPLLRSFGVFDSTIDKASGGDASANWRYAVWQDGWKKIMETPLTGKGFGNLPEHVESADAASSTDFEKVLAGGEAHNGFVTAAYGFGIPFMVALSVAVVYYFFKEASLALRSDKHDPEMRDLHAFLAGMFVSYPVLIYTAFDLSITLLWTYVAISCVLSNLPRQQLSQPTETGLPLRKYGEEQRAAGSYSYRPR
jgi:O-antigen ligase